MHTSRDIMGMPITVEIVADDATAAFAADEVFAYLTEVDRRFSTYRADSEISALNAGRIREADASAEMREVLTLSEQTLRETKGYFDIRRADGARDPSGLVKGWAIHKAAALLDRRGLHDFYIDGGGDIETRGRSADGSPWTVGIRHPFQPAGVVKRVRMAAGGIATSGNYLRGDHVYDPVHGHAAVRDIVSLTVIGPNVYEADRFATAALAMGESGIQFVEHLPALEGYMIDRHGMATMTSGFERYVVP